MIVVEELTPCTEALLKKLLARIETGRLVYPGRERLKEKFGSRVKETVRLSGGFEDSGGCESSLRGESCEGGGCRESRGGLAGSRNSESSEGCEDGQCRESRGGLAGSLRGESGESCEGGGCREGTEDKFREYREYSEKRRESELFFTAAGWNFQIKSCGGEKLMMLHCLAESMPGESKKVSGSSAADSEKTGNLFEECVMDVKGMDGWQKCTENPEPDGYECALGCVLHCDYDVCSYRSRAGVNSGLTGTILLPELSPEGLSQTVSGLGRNCLEKVRFFVTGQPALILQSPRIKPRGRAERHNRKRYYIGTEQDFCSCPAGEFYCGGIYQVPVFLEDRAGLCCSGFLKYRAASLK